MRILALDTATPALTLAVLEDDRVLAESNQFPGRTHSRVLVPEMDRGLRVLDLTPADLDLIAVGIGPGSFTGLRIGLAAAKGLAWAAAKPLIGVPTLDALARAVAPEPGWICPLLNARRGQVFAALYRPGPKGNWERQTEYGAFSAADLAVLVREKTMFFGEGVRTAGRELSARLGPLYLRGPEENDFPRATQTARVARELYLAGAETDPGLVVPLYIRPPDIREPKERAK
ncbi:MAG: tRNA (adenosine(37)-N6)-threonylcarbamoyltransferase complex dimerization subunit type 1 TsaB [Thermodesulfobacteriota bacterium]